MEPGAPQGGRQSSSDVPEGLFPAARNVRAELPLPRDVGFAAPRYEDGRYEPPSWTTETAGRPLVAAARSTGRARHADATGPLVEPAWWSAATSEHLGSPLSARHSREEPPGRDGWTSGHDDSDSAGSRHPSAPLPPMPSGVWDRLHSRSGDDAATVAQPLLPGGPRATGEPNAYDTGEQADDSTEAHSLDPREWEDQTGALDVIGAHVAEEPPRRFGRRARREAAEAARRGHPDAADDLDDHQAYDLDAYDHDAYDANDLEHDVLGPDGLVHDEHFGEDIPVKPYDRRSGRPRRRRRPVAILISLLALAGLVVGIVVGGQKLLTLINPTAQDFPGQGTGAQDIRVQDGDTLSDIARTLVDAGVIASTGPFVEAAEADPDAVGIQPGVYSMRKEMSGQAALDLLLDPVARQLARVTLPEGLTVQRTLARLAETTGKPEAEFQAAVADPAALGVPAYANGQLEGFLFPATYEFEPDATPADMLREMVAKFNEVAGGLQLEQQAAAMGRSPAEVVTVASMIESETRLDAERPDVAQVIYNRLGSGIALGIDATLAYGLQKNGNDLTVADLQTDGPYNTRTRPGLPPTPISAPGEASLQAALSPSSGSLLYYVLQSADGSHFFTDDYAEFEAARQRCAAADLGCGG